MKKTQTSCNMCGECCYYEIPLTLFDIHRMAEALFLPAEKIFQEYIQRKVSPRSALFMIAKREDGACLFLSPEQKCAIHGAKPKACGFFICTSQRTASVIPWTASWTMPSDRAELWAQSVAAEVTKVYLKKNGTTWNDSDFSKAIAAIHDNIAARDTQKIKLGRCKNGSPLAMIYDCSQCDKPGAWAQETPVTLDDARRIILHLGITWKIFFRKKIARKPSISTGGLKLKRKERCIFFRPGKHCAIRDVRPMHCRLTPCPNRTKSADEYRSLFLGSGTVQEQFRHQVALEMTRQYVRQCGTGYNRKLVGDFLGNIDRITSRQSELQHFCRKIAPFRYVDDTLSFVRTEGHEEITGRPSF